MTTIILIWIALWLVDVRNVMMFKLVAPLCLMTEWQHYAPVAVTVPGDVYEYKLFRKLNFSHEVKHLTNIEWRKKEIYDLNVPN